MAALLKLVSTPPAEGEVEAREAFDGDVLRWSADEVDELTDRLDDSVRDARRLSAQLERAEAELRQLRDRSRRLADALGACSACWGEDSGCRECEGCGRPGRSLPDERLFAEIVMPAVRLVRLSDHGAAQPRPDAAPSGAPRDRVVVNLYANALLDRGPRHR